MSATTRVRRPLRSRVAVGGAMLAAALMAITCSVPASAASAQVLVTAPAGISATGPALQTLESGTGTPQAVARDSYTVAVPAPVAAPAAPAAAAAPAPVAAAPAPAAPAAGLVQWPVPSSTPVSDGFGPRVAPCAGCSTFHKGVDLTAGEGSPIHAIADGVVSSVSAVDDGGLGVHAVIDHVIGGQKVSSTYGHMIQGSLQLSVGQTVTVGQLVGNLGSTGQSTGPHLHFEILLGGTQPTDPLVWLASHAS